MSGCGCFPARGEGNTCTCEGCWACTGHAPDCTCDIAWDCEHGNDGATTWPSGIGGAQCFDCGRTTVTRGFDHDVLGEPQTYLCRECYEVGK